MILRPGFFQRLHLKTCKQSFSHFRPLCFYKTSASNSFPCLELLKDLHSWASAVSDQKTTTLPRLVLYLLFFVLECPKRNYLEFLQVLVAMLQWFKQKSRSHTEFPPTSKGLPHPSRAVDKSQKRLRRRGADHGRSHKTNEPYQRPLRRCS